MVKPNFQHLSSSQPGESHLIQETTDCHHFPDGSVLSEIETSNVQSSLLKLLEVDRALALMRTV